MLQKQKNTRSCNSVNPLYLLIYKIDGFIQEKGGNRMKRDNKSAS